MNRWKMAPRCLAAAFAGALAAGSAGCNQLECGTGTLDENGVCVPADEQPGNAQCGPGTKLDPGGSGKCVPERSVMCDPDTTREEILPTGEVVCIGTTGTVDCSGELSCSAPASGMFTICGRLYDSQTDQQITDGMDRPMPCDLGNPTATGPCSLELTFVDALQFAMNPATAPPLVPRVFTLDTCGRYQAIDLPTSSFGFIGIAVDDAGAGDLVKLTGVALDQDNALPEVGFRAYATRNQTDMDWTSTSGISGQSFATRGVLAAVFRHDETPRPGVMIRRASQLIPNDDFYFSDSNAMTRNTVVPANGAQTSTGTNGTALVINSGAPEFHDGVGAEPPNCRWPNVLAASIPGVVFMQLKDSEGTGGPGAACPP